MVARGVPRQSMSSQVLAFRERIGLGMGDVEEAMARYAPL